MREWRRVTTPRNHDADRHKDSLDRPQQLHVVKGMGRKSTVTTTAFPSSATSSPKNGLPHLTGLISKHVKWCCPVKTMINLWFKSDVLCAESFFLKTMINLWFKSDVPCAESFFQTRENCVRS